MSPNHWNPQQGPAGAKPDSDDPIRSKTREIFALRKGGHPEDAWEKAQELLNEHPGDEWVRKAAGWVIYDLLKKSSADPARPADLFGWVDRFKLGENDELLAPKLKSARGILTPEGKKLGEANRLSRAGQGREAIALYRELVEAAPENEEAKQAFGWELFRKIRYFEKPEESLMPITESLRDYARLKLPRGTKLHSCILFASLSVAKFWDGFGRYFRWWGPDQFMPEDLRPYERIDSPHPRDLVPRRPASDGRAFPSDSLKEKALKAYLDHLAVFPDAGEMDQARELALAAIKEYPENHWLTYSLVKALTACGRLGEARPLACAFLRTKASENWAWGLLSETWEAKDPEKIACLCRALLCDAEEKFRSKLRRHLGEALAAQGDLPRARREWNKAQSGASSPPSWVGGESQGEEAGWMAEKARLAEELPVADLQWSKANFTGRFTLERGERLGFATSSGRRLVCRADDPRCQDLGVGDPVQVKFDPGGTGWALLWKRREGEVWDAIQEQLAVVYRKNTEKRFSHLVLDHRREALAYHEAFPVAEGLPIGSMVHVRVLAPKEKDRPARVITCRQAGQEAPPEGLLRTFTGCVQGRPGQPFAFMKGAEDVFIPPHLVEANRSWLDISDSPEYTDEGEIEPGQTCIVKAVNAPNPKRGTWGWTAIHLELGTPGK